MILNKYNTILVMIVLSLLVIPVTAKGAVMSQKEFVRHLFNHLELVDRDINLNVDDQMQALTELNFLPKEGYRLDENMTFGEMAVVLTRIYDLEEKLKPEYSDTEAIQLLVDKKILKDNLPPESELEYSEGILRINEIPRSPSYLQRTVLLPRYVPEGPASPCK